MNKKFLPAWQPAFLVEGADRWYIRFYCLNDATGKMERFRPTFSLNRITNLQQRRQMGQELCQKLNWWMAQGKPISKFDAARVRILEAESSTQFGSVLFATAMADLLEVLAKTMTADTMRTYRNIGLAFVDYLKVQKLHKLKCNELDRTHAMMYLDHCLVKRKLAPRTYNNQVGHLRTLCNRLLDRGYLEENPFAKTPMLRAPQKSRRNFAPDESRAVAAYIRRADPLLFYALILEYSCYIRPNEIRKLRFRDLDLQRGMVHVQAANAKDHEHRYPTIPSEFLPLFDAAFFESYPEHWFIFGRGWQPSEKGTCGRTTMYNKHLLALKELKKRGELKNIAGLTWYSWKDTGITDALEDLPLMAVRDQAGHSDAKMTLKYYHKARVNKGMQRLKNRLV